MTNLHQVKRQRSWLALKGALCIEERSTVPGGEQGQEGTSQSEGGLGLPMGWLFAERAARQGEEHAGRGAVSAIILVVTPAFVASGS